MRNIHSILAIAVFVVFVFCIPQVGTGQTFSVLYSFTGGQDSRLPLGNVVQDSEGNLYGTATGWPTDYGVVFKLIPSGQYTVLHRFNLTDGAEPVGSLVLDSNGFLYGVCATGGQHNTWSANQPWCGDGVIYKIRTDGSNFQVIHYFDFYQGKSPQSALLLDSQGYLYGTTYQGGAYGSAQADNYAGGVVYSLDTSGNNYQVLHSFDPNSEGHNCVGGLAMDIDGVLYGTASFPSYPDPVGGMVFKIGKDGSGYQILHQFDGVLGGPRGTLALDANGMLYGVCGYAGVYNHGATFKLDTSGNNYQVIHYFDGANGSEPVSGPVLSQGTLYGTTYSGGTYDHGVIFKMDPSGGNFQVLRHFDGTTGASPHTYGYSLLLGQGGIFYGTTSSGGASGLGVVYSVTPAYNVCPLYDQTKAVKSGATIPIKLQLCDANGANLSSSNVVVTATTLTRVSDNAPGTIQDSGNANPDTNFRYDPILGGTGGYIFNLSTKGLASGTYKLSFAAGSDSTVHSVQFQVK